MPRQSVQDRIKQQSEVYRKEYNDQRRLSPDELNILAEATIRTQTEYIAKLEGEKALLEVKLVHLQDHLRAVFLDGELFLQRIKERAFGRTDEVQEQEEDQRDVAGSYDLSSAEGDRASREPGQSSGPDHPYDGEHRGQVTAEGRGSRR